MNQPRDSIRYLIGGILSHSPIARIIARRIQALAQITCTRPCGNELRIERVVHLSGKHLLTLSRHRRRYYVAVVRDRAAHR